MITDVFPQNQYFVISAVKLIINNNTNENNNVYINKPEFHKNTIKKDKDTESSSIIENKDNIQKGNIIIFI